MKLPLFSTVLLLSIILPIYSIINWLFFSNKPTSIVVAQVTEDIVSIEAQDKELEANLDKIKKSQQDLKRLMAEEKARLYEIDLLARIINAEAGNQSEEGQLAVATVVMNRKNFFGGTVLDIISAPNQFCGYTHHRFNMTPNDRQYELAELAYDGNGNLPPRVMYFKANYSQVIWSMPYYTTIGDHHFYLRP